MIKKSTCRKYGVNTPENCDRYRLFRKFHIFHQVGSLVILKIFFFQLEDNHNLESTAMNVLVRTLSFVIGILLFYLEFFPCKSEQSLPGMELQEKVQKH